MPQINRKPVRSKSVPYVHEIQSTQQEYYSSKTWRNLRRSYLHKHPFCECCESRGITRLATQVHHKCKILSGPTPSDSWEILEDENNLLSVCNECHHNIHNNVEGYSKFLVSYRDWRRGRGSQDIDSGT